MLVPKLMALALVGAADAFHLHVVACSPARHAPIRNSFDWKNADIGSMVDVQAAPDGTSWARAAWAVAADEMSSSECYMIDESDGYAHVPDPSKQYYFCPSPNTDVSMICDEMPEWMGTMPDGTSVFICTKPKMAA